MTRPDFFIVGAAKSGTTSMHDYLRQHPAVFMPCIKELNYFGSDRPSRHSARMTLDEYLANFGSAPAGGRVGEASVTYLRSTLAAQEIAAFEPTARNRHASRPPGGDAGPALELSSSGVGGDQ